jgi:transketolase
MYIRIGSQQMPVLLDSGYDFRIGKGVVVHEGTDVTIIGSGTVLFKAYEASERLKNQGISVRLIYIHTIKPIDRDLIIKAAQETGKIITIEEHSVVGGLGSAVAEVVSKNYPVPVKMIGIPDIFASNGPYEKLLGAYGMQTNDLVQTAKDFLS